VINKEGPLLADVVAQRIARAHGWPTTGGRIHERIDLHLRGYDTTSESSGAFLWKKGSVTEILPYRPPANEQAPPTYLRYPDRRTDVGRNRQSRASRHAPILRVTWLDSSESSAPPRPRAHDLSRLSQGIASIWLCRI
jgi:hypothetical protein